MYVEKMIGIIDRQLEKAGEYSTIKMVGEQIKEIAGKNENIAKVICEDIEQNEKAIIECEKKISDFARNHKTGNSACVPPKVAEGIIKEHFGIAEATPQPQSGAISINIMDFM
ncbi:MAG: hypothetical protein RR902_00715 [Oscillospiraceae bacterium]